LILYTSTGSLEAEGITDNPYTECAVYLDTGKIVLANNNTAAGIVSCLWKGMRYSAEVKPGRIKILDLL